jgi:1,4-dihydroxy-2-naphthoate polyprenyltransferase
MTLKQILMGMRLPFLTGSVLPALAAAAYASRSAHVSLVDLAAVVLAVACLHLGSNLFNDYYDTDTTDRVNRFRTPFSGGSRIVLDGVLSARGVFLLSSALFGVAGLLAVYFTLQGRPLVWAFGLAGAAIGFFYSSRVPALMSRGLGEICIFIAFGPLLTLGAGYALTGLIDPIQLLVGALPGFHITAVLWINQFPDFEADSTTGKRNLVVRLGKARSRAAYITMMVAPFVAAPLLAATHILPWSSVVLLFALPLVAKAVGVFRKEWDDPRAIVPAQGLTIASHLATTLLLTVVLWLR